MEATGQRSLSSVYELKTVRLLGLEGLEHFVRPAIGHITFSKHQKYPLLKFPISVKYAVVFLQVLIIA